MIRAPHSAEVTAVIPTTGRVSLKAAVQSVLRQSVEVIPLVVLDDPSAQNQVCHTLRGLKYHLISTPGGCGTAAARNLGAAAAGTEYVAFLDDDDQWVAQKTERRLAQLRENLAAHGDSIVSARILLVGETSKVVPESLYEPGTDISSYVLDRSTLRLRRCFMQSSSLLCRRRTALQVPWNEKLARHQDWDWLVALQRHGVHIAQLPDVLVRVFQHSPDSVSNTPNWQASVAWLQTLPPTVTTRARGDFITSIVARGAFESGSLARGAQELLRGVAAGAHPAAAVVGLTGLVRYGRYRRG